jgi:hypothetical protein
MEEGLPPAFVYPNPPVEINDLTKNPEPPGGLVDAKLATWCSLVDYWFSQIQIGGLASVKSKVNPGILMLLNRPTWNKNTQQRRAYQRRLGSMLSEIMVGRDRSKKTLERCNDIAPQIANDVAMLNCEVTWNVQDNKPTTYYFSLAAISAIVGRLAQMQQDAADYANNCMGHYGLVTAERWQDLCQYYLDNKKR